MAIKSTTYSGWQLSGEDASTFLKQVISTKPNPHAEIASERGRALANEYLHNGYVTLGTVKLKSQEG